MESQEKLKINVEKIIRAKTKRWVPKFLIKWLERTIHQKDINLFFDIYEVEEGLGFVNQVLDYLKVEIKTEGEENIPANGEYIFASNHPLGGLDGLAMLKIIGEKFDGKVKFPVNSFLMNLKPLAPLCVAVNVGGRQQKRLKDDLDSIFASRQQMLIFPAGVCSRLIEGKVQDLPWRKFFVDKAREHNRPIIPVYFEGENSKFFYRLARIRKALGIKFNIELLYLPDEMFRQRGKTFTIRFGKAIQPSEIINERSSKAVAQEIRQKVYELSKNQPYAMENIIGAVPVEAIKAELTADKFLRHTNKGGNEIYVATAQNSPNIMREIGRLRELSFRTAGGGTGKSCDIDEFDLMEVPYKQLFIWDPSAEQILGGYRFIHGRDVKVVDNRPLLATSEEFNFSEKFLTQFMPNMIELGRSFVQPEYQSTKRGTKSLFALDNLWDGLGALFVQEKDLKYLFGKVTIYPHYNDKARDMILGFIDKEFFDIEGLVRPNTPLKYQYSSQQLSEMFSGENYAERYKKLKTAVMELGTQIPPLVNSYITLTPRMRSFGAAIFKSFGSVIEFGIMVEVNDIYDEKKKRHIESYLNEINENRK